MKIKNFNAGFSLIEMIVALAVFASAAIISIGAMLSMNDAQQKILALRVAQDNLSYALDTMGKEIRTGTLYYCGNSIPATLYATDCSISGGSVFSFRNTNGTQVNYRVVGGRLERSTSTGAVIDTMFVTAPQVVVNIENMTFYVRGAGNGTSPTPVDYIQPKVLIILSGTSGLKEKVKTRINMQTTISQRSLDQ